MSASQPHEMQLVRTHASGAEEWYCPTCGRRFLMHWPPAYKKIVLEPGDEFAAHIGGKGAAQFGSLAASSALESEEAGLFPGLAASDARTAPLAAEEIGPVPITDELRPWLKWMQSVGLAAPESAESAG